MRHFGIRFLASAVAVFFSATLPAHAAPIENFVVAYSDSLGLVSQQPLNLPNLTSGGTDFLGLLPIVGPTTPSNPVEVTPVTGTFNLQIGWADNSSTIPNSLPGIEPLLSINGTLSGSVVGPAAGSTPYSGNFSGTIGGIEFPGPAGIVSDYADLNALSQHTERIHIWGDVITASSGKSYLETFLTIDSPEFVVPSDPNNVSPVPEPSTWLVFLVAIGGLAVRRFVRRRRRSGLVGKTRMSPSSVVKLGNDRGV